MGLSPTRILSFLLTLQSHIANSAPNQYNIFKPHELKLGNWLFLEFKGSCATVTLVERSAEAKRRHCGATFSGFAFGRVSEHRTVNQH
jgi:hypothetical protein